MKQNRWGKILATCMAAAIILSNTPVLGVMAYAEETVSEEDQAADAVSPGNTELAENPGDNGEPVDNVSDQNEKEDRANSWRYRDGELIAPKLRYTQYQRWPTDIQGAVRYGIDVSEHQGKIDWSKVKADGVDYAIVRCGYGMNDRYQDDEYWVANAEACERYGIPFGTYLYSYADTVEKAKSEAEHVLRLVKGYDLSYPIYYDLEHDPVRNKLSRTQIADIAEAFCDTIEAAGYEVAIYANTDWFTNYLTDSRFDQWDKWVAQYNTTCTYTGRYTMWQCSSQGKIDGITGNVDLNIEFSDDIHSVAGANGFCQSPADNQWYYYINGKVQYSTSSVISGTVNGTYGWWHVVEGKVVFDNTVARNSNGWWVIQNGKVNFEYTGYAENSNGWWYCKGGKVQFDTDDVINGTLDGTYGWWVVRGGKVNLTYTGYAENSNGWWYCKEGKVQTDTNSVISGTLDGTYGWWVVRGGKVNLTYTGYAENSNGWWYCKEGKVQTDTSSVINGTLDGTYGWWYVVDGKVIFDDTVARNSNGWWVIQNGKVNFGYTGYAKNSNGWWYCKDGKVQFGTSSVISGTVDGTYGWWHVVEGKVKFDNTVARNSNGWWVIQEGKVNFDFNGIASNSNGSWLCQNGKVNFNYNGKYQYKGRTYTIREGKVVS